MFALHQSNKAFRVSPVSETVHPIRLETFLESCEKNRIVYVVVRLCGSRPLGLQGDHGERAGAFQELHSVPIGTQPVQNVGPREAPICPRRKQPRLQTNTLATNESEPWLLSIPPTNPLSADESVDEGGRTGYSQLTASVALSLWWGQHVCECVRVGRGMSRGTLTASRELCRWRPISPVD